MLRGMGRLVAIEGLDGAGKNTVTTALITALERTGATVATVAFPRYGNDIHAELASDALHGMLGDVADSVYAMAVLFALDRRDAAAALRERLDTVDVVIADRYVASNAAYSAARLKEGVDGPFVQWLIELEIDRFGIPVPDLQVLLDVPVEVAAERALRRAAEDATRARDSYESDNALQTRCADRYRELAETSWLSPWHIVRAKADVDADELVRLVTA
jgi:dTMP kinase